MTHVDVLIVTALKSEYVAARDVGTVGTANNVGISSWDEKDLDTPAPYLLGNYRRPGGGDLLIALARPTRMGADSTAPVVSSLVERLKPTCLAMCGVCAGNPADVALGDVIVAEMAYTYDEGKRTSDSFQGDHRTGSDGRPKPDPVLSPSHRRPARRQNLPPIQLNRPLTLQHTHHTPPRNRGVATTS
jgi:nucleoside phosphorylase